MAIPKQESSKAFGLDIIVLILQELEYAAVGKRVWCNSCESCALIKT